MDNLFLQIIKGRICVYCSCQTRLVSGDEIYPHRALEMPRPAFMDKKYYVCVNNSDHYVGTYADNKKSLGRVADKELRNVKNLGHKTFDPLWKNQSHFKSQKKAYRWLAKKMNLPVKYTHFGMFTVEQCLQAIQHSKNLLNPGRTLPE